MTRAEQLQSIRERITAIRQVLADPKYLTNVSISGMSETIDRESLRRELTELERQEESLSGAGTGRRLRRIDMRGV